MSDSRAAYIVAGVLIIIVLLATLRIWNREGYSAPEIRDRREGRRKFLVYTSAGDSSAVRKWVEQDPDRNWDLAIVYYGKKSADEVFPFADIIVSRKDGKFPNAQWLFNRSHLSYEYDFIAVFDDDLLFSPHGISMLFLEGALTGADVFAPGLDEMGKLSWPLTKADPDARWRYTNFVEMNAPVFRADLLRDFLAVLDPELKGFGADWWYLNVLRDRTGGDLDGHVAIVDSVPAVNPHDELRANGREIETLQDGATRRKIYSELAGMHGIDEWKHEEYYRQPIGQANSPPGGTR